MIGIGSLSRRQLIYITSAGVLGTTSVGYWMRSSQPVQTPEHARLVDEIRKYLYSRSPILDRSEGGFFLRVPHRRVEHPQGLRYKDSLVTIVTFEGEANEIIGVSSEVPHPRLLGRGIEWKDEGHIRYLILNPRDPEYSNLPTLRGGYDGRFNSAYVELLPVRTEDLKLDGHLEGIIEKTVVDRPKSEKDAEEVRKIWGSYSTNDLIKRLLGLVGVPPAKNGIPENYERFSSAQNSEYLMVLRRFNGLLGKAEISNLS